MNRPNIGKTAPGTDDGKGSLWITPKKEQPGILLAGVFDLFLFGIDVIKDLGSLTHGLQQIIYHRNGSVGMNVAVVRKETTNISEVHGGYRYPMPDGKEELSETIK